MAFDQSPMHNDLRPLNICRTIPEDPRISPATCSGRPMEGFFAATQHRDGSPGSSIPMLYIPGNANDARFVGLGYSNGPPGVATWVQQVVPAAPSGVVPGTPGFNPNSNFGPNCGSDHTSDEGGEDLAPVRIVKFLCSFGGKILPRPSDGTLRYVGGQTRILSIRRDVSFSDLVKKVTDTCGQDVAIKYQLPDEDLDALVSISCPDDLDNMMDEYQKLAERSSDGSAKLRMFLFPASEMDSPGVMQFGDLQDTGQRYVEAVNGITDGGIARFGSTASAVSTQNSDLSSSGEVLDFSCHVHSEITRSPSTDAISPSATSALSPDSASRMVYTDTTPAIYANTSAAPFGIPMVRSGLPGTAFAAPEHASKKSVPVTLLQQQQQQQQTGYDLKQPSVTFPMSYVDPQREALSHADYVHSTSQMSFPTQLMGTIGPVFTQQHITAGATPQQFVPAVHTTMTSHVSMNPNLVPRFQPQQTRLEQHPSESTVGQQFVQFSRDQGCNTYQPQLPTTMFGGPYGWHQIPHPQQVAVSEGWAGHPVTTAPEATTRYDDCQMCQKSLPHAHSDTAAQNKSGSPVNSISDSSSGQNLELPTAVTCGTILECTNEQGAAVAQRFIGHMDREIGQTLAEGTGVLESVENPEHPKVAVPLGVMGLTTGVPNLCGAFMGTVAQSSSVNAPEQPFVPMQYQVKQEVVANKAVPDDLLTTGMRLPTTESLILESPNGYTGHIPMMRPKEDNLESTNAYEHLKQIEGRMENLRIQRAEILANSEQNKSLVDNFRKNEFLESRSQQVGGREVFIDSTFSKNTVLDTNHLKPYEMSHSPRNEPFYFQTMRAQEPYEAPQPSRLGDSNVFVHSKQGVYHLAPDEIPLGSCPFSGLESTHPKERVPLFNEHLLEPRGIELVSSDGNTTSVSPSFKLGDAQESSNSLFSNQDPWCTQHDAHFPPQPNKLQVRKEPVDAKVLKDNSGVSCLGSNDELPIGSLGGLGAEMQLNARVSQLPGNLDIAIEHTLSNKGSAEEMIKQEIQAVAEGVATSVLHSSMSSDRNLPIHGRSEPASTGERNGEDQIVQGERQYKDKFEEIKTKCPVRENFGFPVSDDIGHLQIIKNSDLEEIRELGSGTFGTVYHGKWRGTDVAIKRINARCFAGKHSEQERMRNDFWNEAIKLADLHHPNVVAFYGVVLDGPGGSVATVTEYMVNGSLRTALQKSERNLDKWKCLLISMDVAFGMEYLHGKNIVHFDLKSDNLLVNLRDPHRPICKVGDLGLSKVKCQTLISGGVRGTLPWMAPELLNGSSSLVCEKVDVFSFGIVMWELLTGEEPYADLHYGAIIGGIVSNTLRPPVPESCGADWKSLMERCWSAEPSERPSFTAIANELRAIGSKLQKEQQPISSKQT
nr:Serine/threonine-protein kinase CTR1 [Ipomoea batatas]